MTFAEGAVFSKLEVEWRPEVSPSYVRRLRPDRKRPCDLSIKTVPAVTDSLGREITLRRGRLLRRVQLPGEVCRHTCLWRDGR